MASMATQQWEYDITTLPTEHGPADGTWHENSTQVLDGAGSDGWEAVLVLKREPDFVHLLMKRPRMEPSARTSRVW